jgi:hypothetical protein
MATVSSISHNAICFHGPDINSFRVSTKLMSVRTAQTELNITRRLLHPKRKERIWMPRRATPYVLVPAAGYDLRHRVYSAVAIANAQPFTC